MRLDIENRFKEKKIHIEMTATEVYDLLLETLDKKNKNITAIAETIIDNLMLTDRGLLLLYKAINGIQEPHNFVPGDIVKVVSLHWNIDKKKMEERDMLLNDNTVKAEVITYDNRITYGLRVRYKVIMNNSDDEQNIEDNVRVDDVMLFDSSY